MDNERYLIIVWKDRLPTGARNVWPVAGDITYEDGKLVFSIVNGSTVRIDPDQLLRIFIASPVEAPRL